MIKDSKKLKIYISAGLIAVPIIALHFVPISSHVEPDNCGQGKNFRVILGQKGEYEARSTVAKNDPFPSINDGTCNITDKSVGPPNRLFVL
jgi:hypothetical protein